mgnify:FL=1
MKNLKLKVQKEEPTDVLVVEYCLTERKKENGNKKEKEICKMEMEIWKDIFGYEGYYQISSLGRVKSLIWEKNKKHKQPKILKNYIDKGYYRVSLYKDGNHKKYRVHRLIAQAFIPNPNNLPEINHIDENKLNNDISNLEWCSTEYNVKYGTRLERAKQKNIKTQSNPIMQIDLDGNIIKIWSSMSRAEKEGGYDKSTISYCVNNKQKTHKGFIWKRL